MIPAIIQRRSIRKYQEKPVDRESIREILRAGTLAPSAKNRQPWKFVVVSGGAKEEMLKVMDRGLQREARTPLLPDSAQHLNGAEYTRQILRQAPVSIWVLNPLGADLLRPLTPEESVYELCNTQSIGAAMENMTLTATALGLGSLWICDTYFCYQELREWLHGQGELAAAMALGYADEAPSPRPRKELDSVVEWRD